MVKKGKKGTKNGRRNNRNNNNNRNRRTNNTSRGRRTAYLPMRQSRNAVRFNFKSAFGQVTATTRKEGINCGRFGGRLANEAKMWQYYKFEKITVHYKPTQSLLKGNGTVLMWLMDSNVNSDVVTDESARALCNAANGADRMANKPFSYVFNRSHLTTVETKLSTGAGDGDFTGGRATMDQCKLYIHYIPGEIADAAPEARATAGAVGNVDVTGTCVFYVPGLPSGQSTTNILEDSVPSSVGVRFTVVSENAKEILLDYLTSVTKKFCVNVGLMFENNEVVPCSVNVDETYRTSLKYDKIITKASDGQTLKFVYLTDLNSNALLMYYYLDTNTWVRRTQVDAFGLQASGFILQMPRGGVLEFPSDMIVESVVDEGPSEVRRRNLRTTELNMDELIKTITETVMSSIKISQAIHDNTEDIIGNLESTQEQYFSKVQSEYEDDSDYQDDE